MSLTIDRNRSNNKTTKEPGSKKLDQFLPAGRQGD